MVLGGRCNLPVGGAGVVGWVLAPGLPLSPAPRASLRPGTSLLQEVVYLVSQGADPDEIGLMNIDEQLPVLEYPQPGLDIIKELTSPRLIKSHLPYRFLPSDLHNGDSKVIYMARNPKDLVVSYYQFHRSLRTMSYRGTFQEFCRRFMNDKLGYGSWFEHVQEFWEHRMDSNVLFLKYEDMHRDLVTMVEQLARFLGVSCDKAQLEALSEHCHQLVDQCCNAEALPVGRGTRSALPRVPTAVFLPGASVLWSPLLREGKKAIRKLVAVHGATWGPSVASAVPVAA
uniref:Sulfotransferase n=1 Tax=Suricata suricatta TaxID=37032 RepID=A0A673UU43_SURSU